MKKSILIIFYKVLIIIMAVLILSTQSCRKNPCIYNNCDPEPAPITEECYVTKKLVRQDTVVILGDTLTRFDVDTSYYLDYDVKILGKDSIADNAGAFNIEPHEYCVNKYNYATIKVYDTLSAHIKGKNCYFIKIKAVNNYYVWMQIDGVWKLYAQNGSLDKFMYN